MMLSSLLEPPPSSLFGYAPGNHSDRQVGSHHHHRRRREGGEEDPPSAVVASNVGVNHRDYHNTVNGQSMAGHRRKVDTDSDVDAGFNRPIKRRRFVGDTAAAAAAGDSSFDREEQNCSSSNNNNTMMLVDDTDYMNDTFLLDSNDMDCTVDGSSYQDHSDEEYSIDVRQHQELCGFLQSLGVQSGVIEARDVTKRCLQLGFHLTDRARREIRHFVGSYWE